MIQINESAPNPQFVRQPWVDLTGPWRFRYDDKNVGVETKWWEEEFGQDSLEILVPYPPESSLSGVADPSFHPIVWYQRDIPAFPEDAPERTLIRFGAVDHQATVWIDGVFVGQHTGGSSPFAIEISTDWLRNLNSPQLTLRVFDDPTDTEQPRGKQAWSEEPDGIFYKRTTGIWQPVWMEFVPAVYMEHIRWVFDENGGRLAFSVELNRSPGNTLDSKPSAANGTDR